MKIILFITLVGCFIVSFYKKNFNFLMLHGIKFHFDIFFKNALNACEDLPQECVEAFRAQALKLTNDYRSENSLSPLERDDDLTNKSTDFADHLCDISSADFLNEKVPSGANVALSIDENHNITQVISLTASYCECKKAE